MGDTWLAAVGNASTYSVSESRCLSDAASRAEIPATCRGSIHAGPPRGAVGAAHGSGCAGLRPGATDSPRLDTLQCARTRLRRAARSKDRPLQLRANGDEEETLRAWMH